MFKRWYFYRHAFAAVKEVRAGIEDYKTFCSETRCYSTIGNLSPAVFDLMFDQSANVAQPSVHLEWEISHHFLTS
jgi:hypothetical protein